MENQKENKEQLEQAATQESVQSENSAKKKFSFARIISIILIPVALLLGFLGGYFFRYACASDSVNTTADIVRLMERVGYIYDPVTGEAIELTEEQIADALVSEILDQYSEYYTKEEFETVNQNATGKFSGIGISVATGGEIVDVVFNSPAEKAGLKKGDVVLSVTIDGNSYSYSQNNGSDFMNALLGADVGKTATLTVNRAGEEKVVDVVKSVYVASYVKYYDSQTTLSFIDDGNGGLTASATNGGMAELGGEVAYIQFTQFNGGASEQMQGALDYMKAQGRTKLILDIRDNGGGYLDVLQEIAGYFINDGGAKNSLIAYAEGKKTKQYTYTKRNAFYSNLSSIAVLANENTASASECLLGAMLHYKDCFDQSKLVIEKNEDGVARTYGKGIMQTTYGLIGGGALKLTTAKIYLPDKTTSIHGVGFRPLEQNAVSKNQALARAIAILS